MRFHHLGLEVLSIDDSLGFYCRCLQFELEQVLLLGGEKIYFLTNGDLRLELVEAEALNMHICFEVKEFPANLPAEKEYHSYENGWESCFFQNDEGQLFELLKRN